MAYEMENYDEEEMFSSPPPLHKGRSHHGAGGSRTPATHKGGILGSKGGHPPPSPFLAPPHNYYRPASDCPSVPYHTIAAVYLMNLAITVLLLLGLLAGVRAMPETSKTRFHQLAVIVSSTLAGTYIVMHFTTPLGAFDGFLGAFGVTTILCVAGGAPVLVFKEFREILHHTAHPWLIGPHVLRVLHFLFLSMYDFGLLPLAFAGPTGWGGMLLGLSAPLMGLALASMTQQQTGAARQQVLRNIIILWSSIGALELLMVLALEATFIPSYINTRTEHHQNSRYMWHTVFLVVHYTVPMLLVLHGYTLWKLLADRAPRPTMLWQEDDEDLAALYGPDSPGNQDPHIGDFEMELQQAEGKEEGRGLGKMDKEPAEAHSQEKENFQQQSAMGTPSGAQMNSLGGKAPDGDASPGAGRFSPDQKIPAPAGLRQMPVPVLPAPGSPPTTLISATPPRTSPELPSLLQKAESVGNASSTEPASGSVPGSAS